MPFTRIIIEKLINFNYKITSLIKQKQQLFLTKELHIFNGQYNFGQYLLVRLEVGLVLNLYWSVLFLVWSIFN